MKFTVETWAPEYGVSADEQELTEATAPVTLDVERPAAQWSPIHVGERPHPHEVLFVDGVRRIDARVWLVLDDRVQPGVCASVAAGVVRCTPDTAEVLDPQVRRGLFAGPTPDATAIDTRYGRFDYVACAGDSPEDLYLGIHNEMTTLETALSLDADADLVIFDGPLRGRTDPRGVGYIKTQHVQYLTDELLPVLGALGVGQRTPLFLVAGRFSWYLRLPAERTQPWAGIVRCEIAAKGSVPAAIDRADQVTAVLPRYASEPHKDGRAPQNLYPIAGLETRLRHRLGDPLLLERALRRAAARPRSN